MNFFEKIILSTKISLYYFNKQCYKCLESIKDNNKTLTTFIFFN